MTIGYYPTVELFRLARLSTPIEPTMPLLSNQIAVLAQCAVSRATLPGGMHSLRVDVEVIITPP